MVAFLAELRLIAARFDEILTARVAVWAGKDYLAIATPDPRTWAVPFRQIAASPAE